MRETPRRPLLAVVRAAGGAVRRLLGDGRQRPPSPLDEATVRRLLQSTIDLYGASSRARPEAGRAAGAHGLPHMDS